MNTLTIRNLDSAVKDKLRMVRVFMVASEKHTLLSMLAIFRKSGSIESFGMRKLPMFRF
jgi:hypothetical protein